MTDEYTLPKKFFVRTPTQHMFDEVNKMMVEYFGEGSVIPPSSFDRYGDRSCVSWVEGRIEYCYNQFYQSEGLPEVSYDTLMKAYLNKKDAESAYAAGVTTPVVAGDSNTHSSYGYTIPADLLKDNIFIDKYILKEFTTNEEWHKSVVMSRINYLVSVIHANTVAGLIPATEVVGELLEHCQDMNDD